MLSGVVLNIVMLAREYPLLSSQAHRDRSKLGCHRHPASEESTGRPAARVVFEMANSFILCEISFISLIAKLFPAVLFCKKIYIFSLSLSASIGSGNSYKENILLSMIKYTSARVWFCVKSF